MCVHLRLVKTKKKESFLTELCVYSSFSLPITSSSFLSSLVFLLLSPDLPQNDVGRSPKYLIVLSDENAVGLEKVIRFELSKLFISNSIWAETVSDNGWLFALICKTAEGKVTYEGHYTLRNEAKFSRFDEHGDWKHLSHSVSRMISN